MLEETATIIDACSLSDTFPEVPLYNIPRLQYVKLFESHLKQWDVIFVQGDEGYGLTNTLAQFVMNHRNTCFSYFANDLDQFLYNEELILKSLGCQVAFYINPDNYNSDLPQSFGDLQLQLVKAKRKYSETFYFVLDGFENTPLDKIDGVRKVFSQLPWGSAKFILSGQKEDYSKMKDYLPKSCCNSSIPIMTFTDDEVDSYFRSLNKDISQETLQALRSITGGIAQKMDIIARKYRDTGSFDDYLNIDQTGLSDLYGIDFDKIKERNDVISEQLLALVAFSVQKLDLQSISKLLQISTDDLHIMVGNVSSFLHVVGDTIVFKTEGGHKYIRNAMERLKEQIELLLIDYYEKNPVVSLDFLPSLYRSQHKNGKLIQYLNSENVQSILIKKKSQAALNEQCRHGLDACERKVSYFPDSYRFALCHSASKELEKNELWDNEIEALLSVGNYKDATSLAQDIYLDEERLKSFALIARHQYRERGFADDSLMDIVRELHGKIDFENMPDKSLELAKLLIHVDFTIAMDIADRVAKLDEGKSADRVYTSLSLSLLDDIEKDLKNFSNIDVVNSKIKDSELKAFSNALQTLFDDCSPKELLEKVKILPNIPQQLFLLNNWIYENKEKPQIGIVVKFAIDLIIASSNEKVPKTSYLANICEALPYIDMDEAPRIIKSLDDIVTTIKYPSKDYTAIQVRIIETMSRISPQDAINRLLDLFIYIQDLTSKSIRVECEALILKNYERLGVKTDIEKQFKSSYDLLKHIQKGVDELFGESAYHYQVVEGAIRTLVCDYRSFVIDTISKMNTRARRSRAYLLAAQEYVRQSDLDRIKWDYLERLLSKIDCPSDEQTRPIVTLIRKSMRVTGISSQFLGKLRKFHKYFEQEEDPYVKCEVYASLFCLFSQAEYTEYRNQLLANLRKTWENIADRRVKIDAGYLIACIISNTSQELAQEFIGKTIPVQNHAALSSSSCVVGSGISLDLYVRSLGILIKAGCYEDSQIKEFERILGQIDSPVETIILWSKICLNFYFSNKHDEFKKFANDKVLQPLDKLSCSLYTKKRLYYFTAPTLYFYNDTLLFTRLEQFDSIFSGHCLQHIIRVILYQYPDALDITERQDAYELEYSDYLMLCDLLMRSNVDGQIFDVIDSISGSLTENKGKHISAQHRQNIKTKLSEIVEKKLPIKDGIRHDGYKLACRIAIESIDCVRRKKGDWNVFVDEIEKIPNIADRSFVYTYLARFVQHKFDKEEFLANGFNLARSISSRYDKTQRMKMCIDTCKKSKTLFDRLVKEAFSDTVADKNGTYRDFCDIVDSAQQYDEGLAGDLIEQLDQDPARLHYKENLRREMEKKERLKKAKSERKNFGNFTEDEFSEFFKGQVADLVARKCTIWTEEQLNELIPSLYRHSLSNSFFSVVFIMENLFYRKKINNVRNEELLTKIYKANLWNLKIVLSMASGTKEKLERMNSIILNPEKEISTTIRPGEREKVMAEIRRWYAAHPYDNLKIIDPYFHPEDLSVVKSLFDINDKLQVKVLTHRNNVTELKEYQEAWDSISSDLTGSILINTVCWQENPANGPLHDRWWILKRQTETKGLRLTSMSNFGKKETELSPMSLQEISEKENIWEDYICEIPLIDGKALLYDKIRIRR
ncbi:MAG: hypothetical protein IJ190_01230 [Prevotella sp.]|nr:hypothetical protein [Prevotella sp.]